MNQAATPTGGAEGSARPSAAPVTTAAKPTTTPQGTQAPTQQSAPATIQDRLKAAMFSTPEPTDEPGRADAGNDDAAPAPAVKAVVDGQQAPATEPPEGTEAEIPADGAQDDDTHIRSIKDLAEGLSWDTDRVLDLEVPVKINGKEGSVPLREALKSYQLEGHLNQGLMKLAEERKGFEAETARKVGEFGARIQQLNQAVGLAQKILDGEFADVNWQELQRTDPAAFQAKYGAYNMRLDGIRNLNGQVMQEQEREQANQKAAYEAYLSEQAKLLDTKVPEWADTGKRDKDVAEMVATLGDAFGFTEQEIRSNVDHRAILLAKAATSWLRLQKQKPATLNKVRSAPKLIRPGAQQSRTATDGEQAQKARLQLRRTGSAKDAGPALKGLIY